MLHLKQILHKNYTKISELISIIKEDLKSPGRVHLNSPFLENLGAMLSDLILSVITIVLAIAICISNLSLLIVQILMKSIQQLMIIGEQALNVLSILCRWAVEVKNTILTSKRWQKYVWKEDGDSRQDFTSVYSETHGVHDDGTASRHDEDDTYENEVKKETDLQQRIREAGY